MDVIYIGLPFSLCTEGDAELDVQTAEVFQRLGFHIYPLNAGDDATEICMSYNWHTSFVLDEDELAPTEDFISEHVLWEDFPLLYISAAAATTEDEYTQFVYHSAELASENGLIVAAEVEAVPEEGEDDLYPWREKAGVLWSHGEALPQGGPASGIRLAFGEKQVQLRCGDVVQTYAKKIAGEQFMPHFLEGLLQGKDPFALVRDAKVSDGAARL